jgi:hypothetical protein
MEVGLDLQSIGALGQENSIFARGKAHPVCSEIDSLEQLFLQGVAVSAAPAAVMLAATDKKPAPMKSRRCMKILLVTQSLNVRHRDRLGHERNRKRAVIGPHSAHGTCSMNSTSPIRVWACERTA